MTDQLIPNQANDGTPLDPAVVALAKAIRQHESDNNYYSKGKSDEFGAYQYTKDTWKSDAKKYLGDENASMTPENQDKAAYYSIKELKDAGKTPEQVASIWNSGDENAYLQNKKGKNSYGVDYDVPGYVNSVIGIYKGYKDQAVSGGTATAEASSVPTFTPAPPPPKKTALEKTANTLGTIFGGNKIGEALGASKVKNEIKDGSLPGVVPVDYSKLSPEALARLQAKGVPTNEQEQRQETARTVTTPTGKALLGDAARIGLNFVPAGKLAEGAKVGLTALGVGERAVPFLSKVVTGGAIGYGADVSNNFANGQDGGKAFKPGAGTLLGGTLPFVSPLIRGARAVVNEVLGAGTGVGGKTITEFQNAIAAGGERAKAARQALRGQISPEMIVSDAKDALGQIIKERGSEYESTLSKLQGKNNVIDHQPVIEAFNKMLEDYGVFANPDGTANFSRAPGLARYQKDLTQLSHTLADWGTQAGDNSIVGMDKLKQTIDDFRIGSSDSRKFDSFVTELRNEAKKSIFTTLENSGTSGKKLAAQYKSLLSDFSGKTDEIKEIQRQLSLGDKASTDTAFRKLTTVLRTNNEMRKATIQRLNELTDGKLLGKIAGQQMNEIIPRGLVGRFADVGLAGKVLAGGAITKLLPMAFLTSPRAVAEITQALGLPVSKAIMVEQAIAKMLGESGVAQLKNQGILFGSSAAKSGVTANENK
jgi:hypothetical protein